MGFLKSRRVARMANQKKKKGAKGSKAGRNRLKAEKYQSYESQTRVVERKLRRILKSSGPMAALEYATARRAEAVLNRIDAAGGKMSVLAEQARTGVVLKKLLE